MQPLMDFEPASSGVALGAPRVRTLEGFLSGMSQLMSLQVALSNELLVALVAHEGPFPRLLIAVVPYVCPLVDTQPRHS